VHNSVNYVGKCQILHFRENFRYFRTFSQENFREKRKKISAKISRKCKNENFRFNPSVEVAEERIANRGKSSECPALLISMSQPPFDMSVWD
jgi:hypothetical protein